MRTLPLPADSPPFTKADWDRLPEGFPAQLIDGWLVKEPAPLYGHQRLTARLLAELQAVVGVDRVVPAPCDVVVDDVNVFQPDIVVPRFLPPDDTREVHAPLLVVEVLSPATSRRDRGVKRERLLAAGTGEVWIVDPQRGSVERHDVDGVVEATGEARVESRVVPGFTLVPAVLFRRPG